MLTDDWPVRLAVADTASVALAFVYDVCPEQIWGMIVPPFIQM